MSMTHEDLVANVAELRRILAPVIRDAEVRQQAGEPARRTATPAPPLPHGVIEAPTSQHQAFDVMPHVGGTMFSVVPYLWNEDPGPLGEQAVRLFIASGVTLQQLQTMFDAIIVKLLQEYATPF